MRFLTAILFSLISLTAYSQNDSLEQVFEEKAQEIDSMRLVVKNIVITGNDVTQDDIILREMSLKPGSRFTLEKYKDDLLRIYNLALFTKVEIIPIPIGQTVTGENEITLNVDVQERWYILPLPSGGIEEGEWKKIWLGMTLRWGNFRGRDENLDVGFRVFYNPNVRLRYSVPWIGEKLHLFMSIGGSWSRSRNQSIEAVGRQNGSNTIAYEDENYENIQYKGELTVGRFFGKRFSVFTDYRYNHLRVSQYKPNRTLSTSGVDKYLTLGGGISFDSRDLVEYATKGDYLKATYHRYGFLNKEVNFGRFTIENQSFIPISLTPTYYLTMASKLYTSLAMGAIIPYYNHEQLGYSDDYVRGWKGKAFEGENVLTLYNELRIPVIKPRYIKAKKLMVVQDLPVIKNLDLRYGLYATLIYDIGSVWYKHDNIFKQRFISGAGIGINIIAPFGYIARADWVFRLDRKIVGQIGLSLSAKF